MPTLKDLIATLKIRFPNQDLTMVQLAYDYAAEAHQGQKRANGEPYINHCVACAMNLTTMHVDLSTITAGLLHDVPEETTRTVEDIKREFGAEVGSLIEGITKIGKLKYRGMERYVENLRKMFLALSKDIRVVLIKFADRIHNLETLDALPAEKQRRIALESMEIFAPIAHRLGMWEVKGKLEDLSFKHISPDEYAWASHLMAATSPTKEKSLDRVMKKLEQILKAQSNLTVHSVQGRAKHLYSLYRKLLRHDRDISQVYDLIAVRIVVETVAQCYVVMGLIHGLWKPLRGRIKDYVAQPKPNGYQSLHTTVFVGPGEIVEFQIRTRDMDQECNYGVAAHWFYDEHHKPKGGVRLNAKDKRYHWVNELIKLQHEVKDTTEYLESIKIDVFPDSIFVFTPNGDVISLPDGATPVDFAYHIHSDLGMQCTAAKINNKIMPLATNLKSGDVVEIISDKRRRAPARDWLDFVKTRSARDHIRQGLNRSSRLLGIFRRG